MDVFIVIYYRLLLPHVMTVFYKLERHNIIPLEN